MVVYRPIRIYQGFVSACFESSCEEVTLYSEFSLTDSALLLSHLLCWECLDSSSLGLLYIMPIELRTATLAGLKFDSTFYNQW